MLEGLSATEAGLVGVGYDPAETADLYELLKAQAPIELMGVAARAKPAHGAETMAGLFGAMLAGFAEAHPA
jgi:hypothetical protein